MEPPFRHPYFIVLCLDKSSADSIGDSIRSTVKKAAKLAVYDEIIINVKNHHMPATMRVDTALEYIIYATGFAVQSHDYRAVFFNTLVIDLFLAEGGRQS